jgi:hypothetical protein
MPEKDIFPCHRGQGWGRRVEGILCVPTNGRAGQRDLQTLRNETHAFRRASLSPASDSQAK